MRKISNARRALVTLVIGIGIMTACTTFDADYERDNPMDPINPKIEILSSADSLINHHKDLLNFELRVQDANTPLNELEIKLFSDKDGYLVSTKVNQSGVASLQLSGLSKKVHILIAEVENSLGRSTRDSILLYNTAPPKVNFTEAKLVNNSFVMLSWDESPDPDFEFYKVYRVNSLQDTILIAKISSVEETSFKDFAPLDSLYHYHIKTSSLTFDVENKTNTPSITRKLFLKSQFAGIGAHKYPDYPALLVSRSSSLIGYNYEQDSIFGQLSETETFRPSHSTVGNNGEGMEIYTVNGVIRTELRIYDAFSMEPKESGSYNSYLTGIATDNKGNIITQVDLSHAMLRVSKRGQFPLQRNYIRIDGGVLRTTQSTNEIYIVSTSGSPFSLWHASYDIEGDITDKNSWPYHGGPPLSSRTFEVHPHGEFIITTYTGHIYEKAPSLEHRKALNDDGRYMDFAFSDSGDLLFAADERGWVDIYDELRFMKKVEIEAFPRQVFYDNGQLIVFGESTLLEEYYGVIVLSEEQLQSNND